MLLKIHPQHCCACNNTFSACSTPHRYHSIQICKQNSKETKKQPPDPCSATRHPSGGSFHLQTLPLGTQTLSHFLVHCPHSDRLKQRDLINSSKSQLQLLARKHLITAGDKSQLKCHARPHQTRCVIHTCYWYRIVKQVAKTFGNSPLLMPAINDQL